MSELQAADLTRPVTGYRRWGLTGDNLLTGTAGGRVWYPGVNESSQLPGDGNGTGWYAWHEPDEFFIGRRVYGEVYGAILAWGDLMVGDSMFRAQYARIIGLAGKEDLAETAEMYDVPLYDSQDDLTRVVQEHDLAMPKELLPSSSNSELVQRDEPNLILGSKAPIQQHEPVAPTMWPPIPWLVPPAAMGLICYGLARLMEAM